MPEGMQSGLPGSKFSTAMHVELTRQRSWLAGLLVSFVNQPIMKLPSEIHDERLENLGQRYAVHARE